MIYINGSTNKTFGSLKDFLKRQIPLNGFLMKFFKITIEYAWKSIIVVGVVAIIFSIFPDSLGSDTNSNSQNADNVSPGNSATISAGDPSSNGTDEDSSNCNILRVKVYGELITYIPDSSDDLVGNGGDYASSEAVLDGIYQAENDPNIKGILIMIDSGGGEPVAGQEIAEALKKSVKYTVVVIRQMGASAAYLAATGASTIFASENSDVGSIGVITYIDNYAVKNQKDGIERQVLSMGKYKGMYDPNKPMTEEEKSLIMRDLKIVYENFIQEVSRNRNLPIAEVRILADGSSMTGKAALKAGLIDKIGTRLDAEKYIEDKVGETPVYCDL